MKGTLLVLGLFFTAGVIPAVSGIRNPAHSDTGDTMMMGIYATLGAFLLLAIRKPARYRAIIAFAAWSSLAHAIVMSALGLEISGERNGFLAASAVLVAVAVLLLSLLPRGQSEAD